MKVIDKNQLANLYGGREVHHTSGTQTVNGITCSYTDKVVIKNNGTVKATTHWEC